MMYLYMLICNNLQDTQFNKKGMMQNSVNAVYFSFYDMFPL